MCSCFSRAASVACALTTGFLVHIIINGRRFEIQRFLDEFEAGVTVRSPIGRVGGRPFRLPIGRDVPRAERVDVADFNARRNAEQFVDELLHVRRRHPGRAQPHVNFGGGQILPAAPISTPRHFRGSGLR